MKQTRSFPADDVALERGVATLRAGGVVAFPTETVYGLGADARNDAAVRRVYAIKGRPLGHPVIVHLSDRSQLTDWAREVPASAELLAQRFWPGALTIVLPRSPRASDLVTGGQDTVALRVPSHPIAHALLTRFGGAVIAPSANRFGGVSATRAEHVIADLGDAVDIVIDGGPATIGVESTIVDLSRGEPAILRPGGVTREQLEDALGTTLVAADDGVRAPGTLPSHYAPRARVELADDAEEAQARARAMRAQGARVAVIAAANDDLGAMAHDLYAQLRDADAQGCEAVVVVLPAEGGLATAIRDRLIRAAARR